MAKSNQEPLIYLNSFKIWFMRGCFWNENAGIWPMAPGKGYDIYKHHLNNPAFFSILTYENLQGIDLRMC